MKMKTNLGNALELPSLEQINEMERQRTQAIESLEISVSDSDNSSSVKCQNCGNAVPMLTAAARNVFMFKALYTSATMKPAGVLSIILSAAISTSAVTFSMAWIQQAYAATIHCAALQSPTTGGHKTATLSATLCADKQTAKEAKAFCKSSGDFKCSSSKTAFGAIKK